jgi:hypothetical protein
MRTALKTITSIFSIIVDFLLPLHQAQCRLSRFPIEHGGSTLEATNIRPHADSPMTLFRRVNAPLWSLTRWRIFAFELLHQQASQEVILGSGHWTPTVLH